MILNIRWSLEMDSDFGNNPTSFKNKRTDVWSSKIKTFRAYRSFILNQFCRGELIEQERPLGKNHNCQERGGGGAVIEHSNNGVRLYNWDLWCTWNLDLTNRFRGLEVGRGPMTTSIWVWVWWGCCRATQMTRKLWASYQTSQIEMATNQRLPARRLSNYISNIKQLNAVAVVF